jgi:hypothetical protein
MPVTFLKPNKSIGEATGGKATDLKGLVDLNKKAKAEGKTLTEFVSDDDKPSWQAEAGSLADQMGALVEQMKPMEALQKKYDALKKKLLAMVETNLEASEDFIAEGTEFMQPVKAANDKREISDMDMVKKLMGEVTFMQVAKVTLTDIDAYLTPEEKEKCVNFIPHGGSRSVGKPVKKS